LVLLIYSSIYPLALELTITSVLRILARIFLLDLTSAILLRIIRGPLVLKSKNTFVYLAYKPFPFRSTRLFTYNYLASYYSRILSYILIVIRRIASTYLSSIVLLGATNKLPAYVVSVVSIGVPYVKLLGVNRVIFFRGRGAS
jgi:hypothetical protein